MKLVSFGLFFRGGFYSINVLRAIDTSLPFIRRLGVIKDFSEGRFNYGCERIVCARRLSLARSISFEKLTCVDFCVCALFLGVGNQF